jgi:small-conductance mechanosensitive channel
MKRARRHQGKDAFDLIEEATHLLRTAPAATLAVYYLGAIPFVLGLLYFWADMSRSPFANQHLAEAALGIGALFLWMKFWQAVFARRIRAQIAAEPPPRLNFRRCARIFLTQTILQSLGLFLIPLALVPVIPFAWVYAFFQNVTALADDDDSSVSKLLKKSWKQAALWPLQNYLVLAIIFAFAFYVFLNWATACLMLPELFKMLFGVESAFSKSPYAMLNTTFFAGMFGLTYLCVDPILKTIYALRCFYGESLQSGEDLKAELKSFIIPVREIAAAILFLIAVFFATPANAEDATAPAAPPATQKISPRDLDRTINQTIHERKYVWRMPREKIEDSDSQAGVVSKFFDKIGAMLRKWTRATLDWLGKMLRKLFSRPQAFSSGAGSSGYGWIMSVEILLYSLVAIVIAALTIFLYRVWHGRRASPTAVAEAILPVPDMADENVRADQLPEDGWTKLARELLERGEFRLAMRAFYLASLSHLAAQNLISIARFKSNRDYERELRRRAHSFPNLLSVFGDNVFAFERIWYGMHEANRDLVNQFAANVEKIRVTG